MAETSTVDGDERWYQDAVVYQVHVRAFRDADGDGIGDFRGLVERLDYLQDLGVTAIWLLPFYPSPLRDDGYDIADYFGVHPDYGTLEEVRTFVEEAHLRGLRVITELVCNHTSDLHQWFQRARRAPAGSPEREFYVWSDDNTRYADARIIFKDFELSNWAWDPVARAYYWHRFYSHQPDLNFDNPRVRQALFEAVDFWLGMGVDGLRLDAIPYLYEREGTSCENLPETHQFLRELRAHVDARFHNRMLLAEANQWPEDAVAYFGDGDECHMAFHFPLMPRLFMALHLEDRFPLVDILAQTPRIPDPCQWALFLRNHDELTLEMVTEEERGLMWRAYAREARARINLGIRRRLAPLLGNDRSRIELMLALLLSLPGTPVLYYGDEIGMGDNIWLGDRNGVRTPMQWNAGLNAGFSEANRQRLFLPVIVDSEYHYETINVATQQQNPHSLLWWTKRLIALRRAHRAFGRGSFELVHADNFRVFAYVRRWTAPDGRDERILVVANLSRFVQYVELDLSAHRGLVPVELFGRSKLPMVGDRPYPLTMGPHTFFWFSLEPHRGAVTEVLASGPPSVPLRWPLGGAADGRVTPLDPAMLAFVTRQRWWMGYGRSARTTRMTARWPLAAGGPALALVEVTYLDGVPEHYHIPLAAIDPQVQEVEAGATIAALADGTHLVDGTRDPTCVRGLVQMLRTSARSGVLRVEASDAVAEVLGDEEPRARALIERNNTVIDLGGRAVLKLLRRVEPGPHPERELLQTLERRGFRHAPRLLASLELAPRDGPSTTLALLIEHIGHEVDAWKHALDSASQFLERRQANPGLPWARPASLLELAEAEPSAELVEEAGGYLAFARLLGERVGELHLALAAESDDPAFVPEAMTPFYQRSLYQSVRNQVGQAVRRMQLARPGAGEALGERIDALLRREAELQQRIHPLLLERVAAPRLRVHGDLTLAQFLRTGMDMVLIDFEGDPTRALEERRLKRSVLRDLASLVRSYHGVARAAVHRRGLRPNDAEALFPWAQAWAAWQSAAMLRGYERVAGALLPATRAHRALMLEVHALAQALHELEVHLARGDAALAEAGAVGVEDMLDLL